MRERIVPGDTTIEAARVQFEILRKLTPSQRAGIVFEMSDNLRATVEAGVRHRHPDYNDEMVREAVLRLTLGEDLFSEVFPGSTIKP